MDSLFFSFTPIQKRILSGSAIPLFQQVLATGGPALSTSAVLDTVPAVDHYLSPSVHRGGHSMQESRQNGQHFSLLEKFPL